VTVIFLAGLALSHEIEFVLLYAAFVLIILLTWLRARRISFPGNLGQWALVGLAAGIIALLQGGVLTGLAQGLGARLLHRGAAATSYFSFTFGLVWPPTFISAHLGSLSILNPYQLITLLAEMGPIILVFPLVLIWGWKSFRIRRWLEAAFALMAALSLLTSFIHYSGTAGESATLRLYGPFFKVCLYLGVPLTWIWARRRSEAVKITCLALAGMMMVGGVVLLGFQLIAIQKPVVSDYLTSLDVQVARNYYDRLEPGAMIFDPVPSRAPTVLGRPTDSSLTWYDTTPQWRKLRATPDLHALRAAGYDYALLDKRYWDGLSDAARASLQDACVKTVFKYDDPSKSPQAPPRDFRWLLDLRQCQ
jgi:hypothetical protein